MGKKTKRESQANKKTTAQKAVGASLSVALFAAPLSMSPVMAADLNPDGTMNIDVSNSWVGEAGDEVNLNLLANGVEMDEVTLTDETGWDYTFENLPLLTGEDGEPVVYTITDDELDGYDTQITGDQEVGFTVSNIQLDNAELADDGVLSGTVAVTYKNQDGNTIAFMDTYQGRTGETYEIEPKDIPGHTLIETEGELTGKYAAGVTNWIEFTYEWDEDYTPGDEYAEGIIEARYVNQDGIEIALREKRTGEVGSAYEVTDKEIPGYTFDRIDGLDDGVELLFADGTQVVTYVYTENEAEPSPVVGVVVTKYVNEQGEEIAERERVSGKLDTAYKTAAKDIEGYEFVNVSGDASGTFTEGISIVAYNYQEAKPVVDPEPEPKPEPVTADLSELYDLLEIGMSYEDVVAIMGSNGVMSTDKGFTLYTWTAENDDKLSAAFRDGELVSRTFVAGQDNGEDDGETPTPKPEPPVVEPPVVEPKPDPVTNPEVPEKADSKLGAVYDTIEFGVTYKEAVMLLGTDGVVDPIRQNKIDGKDVAGVMVFTWTDANSDELLLGFMNDKLVSKTIVVDGEEFTSYEYQEVIEPPVKDEDDNGVPIVPVVSDDDDKTIDEPVVAASKFKAYYDAVKYGISYKDAVAIIGTEGTKIDMNNEIFAEFDLPKETQSYVWKAENGDTLALVFLQDKLVGKAATVDGVEYAEEATQDEMLAMVAGEDAKTSDAQTVKAEEGKKLADTATNTGNFIAIGAGLLLAAGAGLFFVNRRRQAVEAE